MPHRPLPTDRGPRGRATQPSSRGSGTARPRCWHRWALACACLLALTAQASHYTGTYVDADGTAVEIVHDARGTFTGRWRTQQGTFGLTGHAADDLGGEGTLEAGSERVPFDITLSPDGMTLTVLLRDRGARFVFRRQSHEAPAAPPGPAPVQPPATADALVGSYRDAQIEVVLTGGGGRFGGRIATNGQTYPLRLEASGTGLIGTFQVGQDHFEVRMALEGDTLVVRTGSATYRLARQAAGTSSAAPSPPEALPATLRLRPVPILDETGFDRPVTALTLMVPHDWTAAGGVLWNPTLSCASAPQAFFSTASADETFRIATIARETWISANFPTDPTPAGCLAGHRIHGVRDYLVAFVERERPGARVLGFIDRPDLAATYAALRVDDPANGLRIWPEAGEITYAFEHRGVAVEERVAAVVITTESSQAQIDGTRLGYRAGSSFGFVIRAPAGRLAAFDALATTVLSLVRVDPPWQAAIEAHHRRIAGIHIAGSRAIHEITMEAHRFVFEAGQAEAAGRVASGDRSQDRFGETIRETRRYFDPVANAPVELPDYYAHAWRLEDGSYQLTNDALIVPYRDWGLDGQLIERMP
jgi:hypothetical protein